MTAMIALRVVVLGTDTDVGKTWVTTLLVRQLRLLGRRVWVHKPVACGDWDGCSSADGRRLRGLAGDGQDPATICPREFPAPASPHLSARAAGASVTFAEMVSSARALLAGPQDLVIEGAGGVLSPLSDDRRHGADLALALGLPVVLVTRPHLGTLNHTALAAEALARRGICCLGLVLNRHAELPPSLATDTVAEELAAISGLHILADLPYGLADMDKTPASRLAQAILAADHARAPTAAEQPAVQ